MTIQQFIEAAIKGGWNRKSTTYTEVTPTPEGQVEVMTFYNGEISDVFLDPEAWKAVGKVKGWTLNQYRCPTCGEPTTEGASWTDWEIRMHNMIYALLKGQTLEEYIATL